VAYFLEKLVIDGVFRLDFCASVIRRQAQVPVIVVLVLFGLARRRGVVL
jgi:hypothetical protein